MRLLKLSVLLSCFVVSTFAKEIKLTENENKFSITSNTLTGFDFVNQLSEIQINKIKKNDIQFIKFNIDGYGENAKYGNASIPVLEKLIHIPFGASVNVNIIQKEEKVYSLSDYNINDLILPSQPSLSKGENAQNAMFYFDKEYYNFNGFHNTDLVSVEILGQMRGQQLGRLTLSPISYNPITNEISVITKLEVSIDFNNVDLDVLNQKRNRFYSYEFEHLFKQCINYIPTQIGKDVITSYPTKYVIISDPNFQSALQPLIDWKTRKGYKVIEGYTNDPNVGNTTSSIYSYLKDLYDNPIDGISPTYLLIVGDDAQVPSFDGTTGNHLSDMYYCEFDGGGDFYPEMYFGRFSATNSGEVEAQVNKTLTHERYLFSDPSFLDDMVLVAGVDASMAPTYGNGQINYATDHYFNISNGLTTHTYLYGSGSPITSDQSAASAAIISDISNGVSFANYTAHCGSSGWSDPSFEVSDISSLQNYDKFGVLIGNCCQSNKFDVAECFGEGILRASNKGAVAYIGGSNNTYWDEDYWWAVGNGTTPPPTNPSYSQTGLGIYDCLMHENGEQESDWFITTGQISHAGNLAVTEAGGSEHYYWEIYHVMGDPSLMPYIGVPTVLIASHSSATPVGTTSFVVNTEENAYVAISMNGILLDAKLADASGIVNLTFPAISNVGVADIVITKQFKQPYEGTLQIISPNGPYVIYSSYTIDDNTGNSNQEVDFGEFISMGIDVQNVGSIDATLVNVNISTIDPYITLINTSDVINVIPSQQTVSTTNPFTFQVSNQIPDQHIVVFNLQMTDNLGNSWNSTHNITVNAPSLDHISFYIDDSSLGNGNGKLDAGETVDLFVDVTNIGHADFDPLSILTANMSCITNYVNFNTSNDNIAGLGVNGQQSTIFNVSIDANTPVGTPVEFSFNVGNGSYSHSAIFNEVIGIINEDYETGDFTQYTWDNDADFPWTIDNINVYEGNNSSKSGSIPNNTVSNLKINVNVIAPGDISFWKFVSSEQDYDFLQFYIDGNKQGEWSGIDNSWSFVSFPVTVGTHEFEWEYDKDGYVEDGEDCAWIDYIVFPPIDLGQNSYIIEDNFSFQLFPNPSPGIFYLTYNDNKIHSINIYDSKGQLIYNSDKQKIKTIIDLKEYSSGTYTIQVNPENITYQIIKH
tara:strand:- start:6643 stop:10101 length:3459 start_codon:yes stop_codon:yes gene_type:complete